MLSKRLFPLVIIGAQWGDEGKGKIVDLFSEKADYVIRFNGGNNAGHTVVFNDERYNLSLLPSGILHGKKLLISQGCVISPKVLLNEIKFFSKKGLKINLTIDPRVHIVMPYHVELDEATERWKGKKATGSLHLGIGYCYEDKNNRSGVRLEDLVQSKILREKLKVFLPLKKLQVEKVYKMKSKLSFEKIYKEYNSYGRKLKKYMGDVSLITSDNISKKNFLFEGAHGTFLDPVFGTYPYTVAIHTMSGAIFPYVGIAPLKINSIGVFKAYTTRVGNGPFITELNNKVSDSIREVGKEYGTVSKRPRRIGWLDLPMLRTACRLSGFSSLALTKIDVLSKIQVIKICTSYSIKGKKLDEIPALTADTKKCKPVYKEFKGWMQDIAGVKKFSDLPANAKTYINFIEKELKVPVELISFGAERNANIIR